MRDDRFPRRGGTAVGGRLQDGSLNVPLRIRAHDRGSEGARAPRNGAIRRGGGIGRGVRPLIQGRRVAGVGGRGRCVIAGCKGGDGAGEARNWRGSCVARTSAGGTGEGSETGVHQPRRLGTRECRTEGRGGGRRGGGTARTQLAPGRGAGV